MINPRAIRCGDCGKADPEVVLANDTLSMTVAFCVDCALNRVLVTVYLEHDMPLDSLTR